MLQIHAPLSNQDVKVDLRKNGFAVVRNWINRHHPHPPIAKEIAFARDSSSFELIHRGLEYETNYHPSPHYADGGHTLEHPPGLTSEQLSLMDKTMGKLAWLWWIGDEDTWIVDPNV